MLFCALRWLCLSAYVFVGLSALAAQPSVSSSSARPKIVFNCAALTPEQPLYARLKSVYTKAFDRLGYDFEMRYNVSLRRALADNRAGEIDGDCGRVAEFNQVVPASGMLRVEVKLLELELSVWSFTDKITVNSMEEIVKGHYVVGYPSGSMLTEKMMKDYKPAQSTAILSTELSLKMLASQRIDVLVHITNLVEAEAKMLGMENKIYRVGKLRQIEIYPYLVSRYAFLKPKLEAELVKEVPAGGLYVEGR